MRAPPLRRFLPHLRETRASDLPADLGAGLAVAAVAVPQAMAYALVAGVPPAMGLYAAALPTLLGGLLGSSRFLVTGPTNPTALLLGAALVAPAVAAGRPVPVEAVVAAALLAGALLVGFALLGVGRASRFLADAVVVGFVTGVGLLIAVGQLPAALGAEAGPGAPAGLVPRVALLAAEAGRALLAADPRALLLAAGVPAAVVALRRRDARLPGALVALAGAALLAWALGWTRGEDALRLVGPIPAGLPALRLPESVDAAAVGPPALAIALLGTVQSLAAARALRGAGDPPLDPDRELFAQGAACLAAGAVGALPTSASLSRSAVARSAGGRSRATAVVSGLAVLALLPLLAPLLGAVPVAALAGLVVLTGLDLLDASALRRAGATRGDAAILAVTLGATLWIDLVQAVYAGVVLSLVLLVRRAGRLHMVEVVRAGEAGAAGTGPSNASPSYGLREIPVDARTGRAPVLVLNVEGDLSFAVAPELADRLRELGTRGCRVVVLRLKRARHLDATALESLRQAAAALRARGVRLLLCGLEPHLLELLRGSDLARVLGGDALLPAGARLSEGLALALRRASALAGGGTIERQLRQEGAGEAGPWSDEV